MLETLTEHILEWTMAALTIATGALAKIFWGESQKNADKIIEVEKKAEEAKDIANQCTAKLDVFAANQNHMQGDIGAVKESTTKIYEYLLKNQK